MVRDGRSIVYVAKVTPPTPLTSSVRVGTRLPAHATALGRVLLADLSLPELRALYPEEHLEAHTPKTPRTVLDLFNLVEADRERGHVFSEGFYESSICTIAAPCATTAAAWWRRWVRRFPRPMWRRAVPRP